MSTPAPPPEDAEPSQVEAPPVTLEELGWDDAWAAAFAPHAAEGLTPARVAIEFNHLFRLYTGAGELQGQHAGRLLHAAAGRRDLAAVGDWVAIRTRTRSEERTATIETILPRRTHFSRKAAGELTEQQVVAANIDIVFLVMGLDRDYNPRRLERYLMLARESGAAPVVLLSKADLTDDLAPALAEIAAIAPGVAIHAVSVRDGRGLAEVRRLIGPGQTGALLGSSGAGKSTLINALLGEDRLATKAVRASDSRGRHTTRHRQLVPLPGGGLLIDTPGMRELQLWAAADTADATATAFDDIDAIAVGCHFTNCRHLSEPRCAVRAAVEQGTLDTARLESFHKLQDEARSLAARQDVRERIQERAQAKTVTRSLRQMSRTRDRT
jgi:ribosome biogenesis GTPase